MKLGKISLAATLALTMSLQASSADTLVDTAKKATDNMKFEGQLKLWYQTMNHDGISNGQADKGFFMRDTNQPNEWGNVEAQLSVSGNANEHLKYKVTAMTVTTFGIENQVTVGQTARPGQFGASNGANAQPFWFHEAYLDYVLTKNTDLKAGRTEFYSPFIYTEKWNATANSFEALVATNTDIPDTTVIGAWIAKGNGATDNFEYAPQVFGAESTFSNFGGYTNRTATTVKNPVLDAAGNPTGDYTESTGVNEERLATGGAAVLGFKNNTLSFMPIQAWGYLVTDAAQAVWVQGDAGMKDLGPIDKVGLQLIGASIGTTGGVKDAIENNKFAKQAAGENNTKDTMAVAAKLSAKSGIFGVYAAYSKTSMGNLPVANMATNYKKTKLPTASIFNDGMVAAQPNTQAVKIAATAKFEGIGNLLVSYGSYTVGQNAGYYNPNQKTGGPASMGVIAQDLGKDLDMNEFDIKFTTKIKDIDLAAMYINVDKTYVPILGDASNGSTNGQTYGTIGDQIIRIIATLKF